MRIIGGATLGCLLVALSATMEVVNCAEALGMPDTFVWGVSTSAYQYEGAWNVSGKGLSIWDTWSHTGGKIVGGDTGDIANNMYNRLEEHVELLSDLGVTAYRFSLSWPRILPEGNDTHPNDDGVRFYSRLLKLLEERSITPYVTLYHWDLPQALQDRIGGWLSPEMPKIFEHYAKTCFSLFGQQVKHWITINEPWSIALGAYYQGSFAPGIAPFANSTATAPYIAGHHLLLAHALAVDTYRSTFLAKQEGTIGIVLNTNWYQPANPIDLDHLAAAERALEFQFGWFMSPLVNGSYPPSMQKRVGTRLPLFTSQDVQLIQGSFDFVGVNHYTTNTVIPLPAGMKIPYPPGYAFDQSALPLPNSKWPLPPTNISANGWAIVPSGMRKTLSWISKRYGRLALFVTENGVALDEDTKDVAITDVKRVAYLSQYLQAAHDAMVQDQVDLRGYFVWSLSDNMEWSSGYSTRFGLVHVERARVGFTNTTAPISFTPKLSFAWYRNATACNCIPVGSQALESQTLIAV